VNKLLATLPPAVQALTGVDLSGVRIIYTFFKNNVLKIKLPGPTSQDAKPRV
jgi:hypothetical protein